MNECKLSELKSHFEFYLDQWLNRSFLEGYVSKRLEESLRYGLKSPGKRLRPLLVLSMALDLGKDQNSLKLAMPAALAVELVHTYSLIHDDLPAMDNDDFRRGRPSMHRRFDEGLAILAGDCLLTEAFVQAASCSYNPHHITKVLAAASGRRGLVAGQAEDLSAELHKDWPRINEAKTARLFEASALMGVLAVMADKKHQDLAKSLGHHFGMAFQLKDDVDDSQGLALGKTASELMFIKQAHEDSMEILSQGFGHTMELIEKTFFIKS